MRFFLLSPIYVAFAWVALLPDVEAFVRIGGGAIALISVYFAVDFWSAARAWCADEQTAHVPTRRDGDRSVPVSELSRVELTDAVFWRSIRNWPRDVRNGMLTINLFVSTADARRFVSAIRTATGRRLDT